MGAKAFEKDYPHLFQNQKNNPLRVNMKHFNFFRYRNRTSNKNGFVINLDEENKIEGVLEYDSTGIALLKCNLEEDEWEKIYQNDYVFGSCMYQDARLQKLQNNDVMISYNSFLMDDDQLNLHVEMMYRFVGLNEASLYFGKETEMLPFSSQRVEKNTVFMPNSDILYTIGKVDCCRQNLTVYRNSQKVNTPIEYIKNTNIFHNTINKFGEMYFSLSTPPVPFSLSTSTASEELFLCVGHVKITHSFLKDYMNLNGVYLKGIKWIYFMYLFVFDQFYNIKQISPLFIPIDAGSNDHLPYLLAFPCGLQRAETCKDGVQRVTYCISYGEGDCRMKFCCLNQEEVEYLLHVNTTFFSTSECSKSQYLHFGFYAIQNHKNINNNNSLFINCSSKSSQENAKTKRKMKIVIMGYYFQHNTGDDGFLLIFQKLFYDNYFYYTKNTVFDLHFCSPYSPNEIEKCDLLLVGGGNVVNEHFFGKIYTFHQKYPSTKIVCMGVEIPYIEHIKHLSIVDEVYTRNAEDLEHIKQHLNVTVHENSHYIPDLLFYLLTPSLPANDNNTNFAPLNSEHELSLLKHKNVINVGVYLARTYYNKEYEKDYFLFISSLAQALKQLPANVRFYFIPFGINKANDKENDYIISNDVRNMLGTAIKHERSEVVNVVSESDNVNEVLAKMRQMDVSICSRFHSFIFSIMLGIPIISVSTTRKCLNIMKEFELEEYIVPMNVNDKDVPSSFDAKMLVDIFHKVINQNNHAKVVSKMQTKHAQKHDLIRDIFFNQFANKYIAL